MISADIWKKMNALLFCRNAPICSTLVSAAKNWAPQDKTTANTAVTRDRQYSRANSVMRVQKRRPFFRRLPYIESDILLVGWGYYSVAWAATNEQPNISVWSFCSPLKGILFICKQHIIMHEYYNSLLEDKFEKSIISLLPYLLRQ